MSRTTSSPTGVCEFRRVGFRNILVHDYVRLDASVVVRILREDLGDLERFRDRVRTVV